MKELLDGFSVERLEALIDDEDARVTVQEQESLARIVLAVKQAPMVVDEIAEQQGVDPAVTNAYMQGWHDHDAGQLAPKYPETLPCPVLLEPGFRFGEGVRTATMLRALQTRAEHQAELDAMTPEQRAEYEAGIENLKAMIQRPTPVAVPPEKWVNPDIHYAAENQFAEGWNDCRQHAIEHNAIPPIIKGIGARAQGWNACRAAMLQPAESADFEAECRRAKIEADNGLVSPYQRKTESGQ